MVLDSRSEHVARSGFEEVGRRRADEDVVIEMSEGRRVQAVILQQHKIPTWVSPDVQRSVDEALGTRSTASPGAAARQLGGVRITGGVGAAE